MPVYDYVARNRSGEKIVSNVFALNLTEAKQQLKSRDMTVLKVKLQKHNEHFWNKSFGGVKFKEKIVFLKYLNTILTAGLSIKKALAILSVQIKNKYFRKVIVSLHENIQHGQSFHESLRKYPKIFSAIFVNLIAVGEASGSLPKVIEYLEDLLTRDYKFRKTIKGAMAYPVVILVLVVSVSVGLIRFIIPRITKIFDNFDVTLPVTTRALIWMEHILATYWTLIIVGTISTVIGAVLLQRVPPIRKVRDAILLKIPVLGPLIKQIQVTRFTQITSSLIKSGLSLVDGIDISSKTIKNLVYRDYLIKARPYIEAGGSFSEYLDKKPDLFEPIVTQMINLGETTGTLENTLQVISDLNEEEVKDKTKTLSELIGPIMLILMAVMVGGVAISIILPIYQLPNLIQQR